MTETAQIHATHTPGPWLPIDEHSGPDGWRVESDAPGYVNDGWIICGGMLGPDAEANARLIAASPDLLAALKALELQALQSNINSEANEWGREALATARAAIAKAGGPVMSGYPVILNGDHAEFEAEHANTPPKERPDWPLPSFDAMDWAEAFCERNPTMDEGMMLAWFAGALMRGYDERYGREHAAAREMIEVLRAHDAYMLDAGYSGPESDALHPKAAENWLRVRAAITKAEGRS